MVVEKQIEYTTQRILNLMNIKAMIIITQKVLYLGLWIVLFWDNNVWICRLLEPLTENIYGCLSLSHSKKSKAVHLKR